MSIQTTLFQKLKDQLANLALSAKKAQEWFQNKVKTVTGNELMGADRERLIAREQLNSKLTGRMVMYFYDPKLKETLPYYDRLPLVIIVKINRDGFTGLNLHYLPYDLRAKLLNGILAIYKTKHLNENKKLIMTYDLLKGSSKTRFFAPCFKQYLFKHVKSKFYVVDPEEWEMVLTLPLERFAKKDKRFVWMESRKKLGLGNG